jgi:hypothetical protein
MVQSQPQANSSQDPISKKAQPQNCKEGNHYLLNPNLEYTYYQALPEPLFFGVIWQFLPHFTSLPRRVFLENDEMKDSIKLHGCISFHYCLYLEAGN